MSQPLAPADIVFDADGIAHGERFDDVYHSAAGGPGQARYVFLAGNDLPQRWRGRASFTVLETGFGLGLNFLCTWVALRADSASPERLDYVAVEKHPPLPRDLRRAHALWPELAPLSAELRARWPTALAGFHRIELAGGRIALTLLFGDAVSMLRELDAAVDAFFLDGFAPAKNPQMWSAELFGELARMSAAGATAATWSVAGSVRDNLAQAGFEVSKRPGFGTKRDMLTAVRARDASHRRTPLAPRRHAVVVGAGLAGCWTAYVLAARGWQVDLIERHARPACEASASPIGVLRPALNLADSINARLSRAALLCTMRMLEQMPAQGDSRGPEHGSAQRHSFASEAGATQSNSATLEMVPLQRRPWARCGVLHVATTPIKAERMARIVAAHGFPSDYVHCMAATEASSRAGSRVAGPAWWLPNAGWAEPDALCRALLAAVPARIRLHYATNACALEHAADGWRITDSRGAVVTAAPVVVIANGLDAARFQLEPLPALVPVRGQVSILPRTARPALDVVVGGDGYVAPLPYGGHCIGATFEPESSAPELRREDHAANLERAARMLPDWVGGLRLETLTGWVGVRAATADRLPICGALGALAHNGGGQPGLYVIAGLGARGLIWAPLAAEIIASELEGQPNPVERSLVEAIRPQRSRGRHSAG